MPTPDNIPIGRHSPVLSTDYLDLVTPGVAVVVDADEAEALGAFEETALTQEDAWDGNAFVEA